MRRLVAALLALLVLVVGYGALDVFDLVPGILTRTAPAEPVPAPAATGAATAAPEPALPTPVASAAPLDQAALSAALPAPTVLRRELAGELADPALGRSIGVTVRDAFTGAHLLDVDASRARVPASTAKILTALAVGVTLDPTSTLPTRVVQGRSPSEVVLVAGGDTLLAPGKGNPTAVAGRAGLADLATQVATALQAAGTGKVTVRLDMRYAAGPRYAPGWSMADVYAGYTQGVSMLGLASQRPKPGHPSPLRSEDATLAAFVTALRKAGITATAAPESARAATAAPQATELGRVESAPVGDVLALALDDSDNALTESLARQATVKAGGAATFGAAVAFVHRTVQGLGVDLTGVRLKDTCGLTSGQAVPARVLGDVLALGASGTVPSMRDTLSHLPVAGLDGTLHDRFGGQRSRSAAGIARAKTGTLTGVSSLAGTVVDRDGRVLTFVVMADKVPGSFAGTLGARAALDRFVAALASCGCR
ncbi:D-alanyl-D-alanine carboxypeptidase / D-alanyl-D-alanine-endopeptidase (penicillin-binding protein 4) [Pedococcus cremeus]|uniref:D-alanyl-D-alanine carboxypeptidase / D-alanyl-D-alanine-endopeptidase (Penicillin-binding protein 4) n=1 Tax=Pedococcus cremeus TaxID=587636 RepID=A0A1H9WDI3_9MICO|nr:D-alanyl-D-alanine carboxypeptidase/D-alanyl-D-alanine-endopeptidase [Pedococcus cremeus]SES31737.1 D-alanyl-D-alanine carboxypeptidase / D-alanyl-D-alanine-endopeptidase (penicillin-binding protein 4) [Pedococcus cremeus]